MSGAAVLITKPLFRRYILVDQAEGTVVGTIEMLEHGNYTYEVQRNIIIFSLLGEFNEQGIVKCLKEQKQQIQSFGSKECFLVVDSRGQSGATPEVYQAVDEFYHNLNCNNLSAIAIIHTSHIMTRLHERDIPELAKYRTQIFPDVESGIDWLKSLS